MTVLRWSFAALAIGIVLGCKPAPAPKEAPSTSASPSSTRSRSIAPILPGDLDLPSSEACRLEAIRWPVESRESAEGGPLLRFVPGGPAFARLYGGSTVVVILPAALSSAGATLSINAAGAQLTGHVEAAELPLYPTRAFVMSNVLVPNGDHRLTLVRARPGFVTVSSDAGPRFRLLEGEPLAERPCSDVGLAAREIDERSIDVAIGASNATPRDASTTRGNRLRAGKTMLAPTPDDYGTAYIDVVEPPDDRLLLHSPRVLDHKGDKTRVALIAWGGTVFGWIPRADLSAPPRQYVDLSHDVSSIVLAAPPVGTGFVVCNGDAPLVGEAGDERHVIGRLRHGTAFRPTRRSDGYTAIELLEPGVRAAPGGALLVRDADVGDCGPSTAQGRPPGEAGP